MIRDLARDDRERVVYLARELGMFDAEGLDLIDQTLSTHFQGESNQLWLVSEGTEFEGVIYCIPEPMTQGTWNVQMLLVSPDSHGQGHGQALMNAVIDALKEKGQRLLIVETSSLSEFQRARDFYQKCGFTEEGRIMDFYKSGDDKVVFSKSLSC
ncbi:GNAT family N-acetyltransferase [Roseofilum reptotaenium CS-1145]|uniref:N-acetyltransferase domain-containing protein n=1 Tax=Roseofilum reptotaenium AO1-A TaxID=1925591 RepID=A0A1L9QRP2_9CYAN|nr:GNAT family N-acetyltransferase [Roseofilum reptotaenium]MDB9515627.1 GNAT family N-acetyltransferase [Roseofilum reptotaenium CS-1145]OJJ25360.1 hypothetical protein BI308_12135 [Roseofilum reptotaenium AO1-A]